MNLDQLVMVAVVGEVASPTLARILELRLGSGRAGRFPQREAAGALRIKTRLAPAAAPEELAWPPETVHWSMETCS